MKAAMELGRTVDQLVRSYSSRRSWHLLWKHVVRPRNNALDKLSLARVRNAARKLGIDLPVDIENKPSRSALEAADMVDRHVLEELAGLYQKHAAVRGKVPQRPHWDACSKQLYFGSKLIKRFRNDAKWQTRILTAFEEEGWPRRIDDPLPGANQKDAKLRLKEAIKSLNKKLRLVRFHGDGTGTGVKWKSGCSR